MISYIFAFSWGITILLAFIGWGAILKNVLFPETSLDWGQKAAWGVSFSIFVGGILNLIWLISPLTILIYLGIGLFYWGFEFYHNKNNHLFTLSQHIRDCRQQPLILLATILGILFLLIQYGGWVATDQFHRVDDYFGYFVFPKKMIEIGSMGPDPFSGRRLGASLGGQPFLQSLVLSVLEDKNLRLIDPGIATLIMVGLIFGFFQENKVSKKVYLWIILPLLLVVPPARNSTTMIMGTALFISLFRTFNWQERQENRNNHWFKNAIIIALITSSLISLKYNFLPAATLFYGFSYFIYIIRSNFKRETIYEFISSGLLILLFLFPWMISLYQSSGTLLFPFLGKGYHASLYYTNMPSPSSEILTQTGIQKLIYTVTDPLIISFLLLSVIYLLLQPWKLLKANYRGASLAFLMSVAISAGAIIYATGARSPRYVFGFVYAGIIVLIMLAFTENAKKQAKSGLNYLFMVMATMVAIILTFSGGGFLTSKELYKKNRTLISNIRQGLSNSPLVTSKEEIKQYTKLQESIPPSEVLLARLNKPFLLNFQRNQIFIIDGAEGTGPPPGLPLYKGPTVLRDYLISHSVRYVAYSYGNELGFPKEFWQKKGVEHIHPWVRWEILSSIDFQENIRKLGETQAKIYDDGENFVIDLLTPKSQSFKP